MERISSFIWLGRALLIGALMLGFLAQDHSTIAQAASHLNQVLP
jgi:hypothetical protein